MNRNLLLPILLLLTLSTRANDPVDSAAILQKAILHFKDSVNGALKYSTGTIKPEGGHMQLNVPQGFKYLNKEQSKYVLTKLWGNPESATDEVVGMLFPESSDPFTDSSYVFVVSYSEIGHVKDEDADKINYTDLLKNLQEDEKAGNEKRLKAGYPAIHLVGWAQTPFYDKDRKILHWAKELKFGDAPDGNTLNYEIRILGRKGMISLNAVSRMYELPLVNKDISKVLDVASFTDGNSYKDFDPKIDKIAAWTIGGLVAGKLLAKAGLFAIILKFLAPLWKFIVVTFVGLGAWFKKKLGRRRDPDIQRYDASPSTAEPTEENAGLEPAIAATGPADHSAYLPPSHPDTESQQ
jgi:uncharacterized membrane-anchored protein